MGTENVNDGHLLHYARQILLPEIDVRGQEALGRSRVLLIGAGGLGCPAAQYLVAAGIGHLTLCDPDRVSASNLPRQILYGVEDIGQLKVESARRQLLRLAPDARIEIHPRSADSSFLNGQIERHDLVLDCSDNFATRHAVNAVCRRVGRPLVSAAAIRWEGQIAVFDFRNPSAPCYACLYPTGMEDGEDLCSVSGVLGPVPGMLGTMQALETIRLLAGHLSPLAGHLLLLDAKTLSWRTVLLRRDPGCPVCS